MLKSQRLKGEDGEALEDRRERDLVQEGWLDRRRSAGLRDAEGGGGAVSQEAGEILLVHEPIVCVAGPKVGRLSVSPAEELEEVHEELASSASRCSCSRSSTASGWASPASPCTCCCSIVRPPAATSPGIRWKPPESVGSSATNFRGRVRAQRGGDRWRSLPSTANQSRPLSTSHSSRCGAGKVSRHCGYDALHPDRVGIARPLHQFVTVEAGVVDGCRGFVVVVIVVLIEVVVVELPTVARTRDERRSDKVVVVADEAETLASYSPAR